MTRDPRIWLLLATIAGLAVAGWVLGRTGLAGVLHAVSLIGPGGFALYCLYSMLSSIPLGLAWGAAAPPVSPVKRVASFTWARMVRESAADILPFSQIGGLVLGARVLAGRKMPPALVHASMLVDMTTEMAAQAVFTIFSIAGFLVLRNGRDGEDLLVPMAIGALCILALAAGFLFAQKRMFELGVALLNRMLPSIGGHAAATRAQLLRIYGHRGRVALALGFNLAAWAISAAGAWVALELMGLRLALFNVVVIEGLVFTLRSVAFMIPGAIGVQEAAYVLLGPLLGLPAEAAVALSLVKRARDLAIGVPVLLGWQVSEARFLRNSQPAEPIMSLDATMPASDIETAARSEENRAS